TPDGGVSAGGARSASEAVRARVQLESVRVRAREPDLLHERLDEALILAGQMRVGRMYPQLVRQMDQGRLVRPDEGDAPLKARQQVLIASLVAGRRLQALQLAQSGVDPAEVPVDGGLRVRGEVGLLLAVELAADVVRAGPERGLGQALSAAAAVAGCREQHS